MVFIRESGGNDTDSREGQLVKENCPITSTGAGINIVLSPEDENEYVSICGS
jgi:hypothetical protein